jgi:hypothetical protein
MDGAGNPKGAFHSHHVVRVNRLRQDLAKVGRKADHRVVFQQVMRGVTS